MEGNLSGGTVDRERKIPTNDEILCSSMHLGEFPLLEEDTNGASPTWKEGEMAVSALRQLAEVWLQPPYECNRNITLSMAFLHMVRQFVSRDHRIGHGGSQNLSVRISRGSLASSSRDGL